MSAAPPSPAPEEIANTTELLEVLVQAKTAATALVERLATYERILGALAPRWSASPQAPRACRTPGCERLGAEPAELVGGMISAETLGKLPPGDAAHADRVKRRTQLESLGLCFACADQIAQAPPLGVADERPPVDGDQAQAENRRPAKGRRAVGRPSPSS